MGIWADAFLAPELPTLLPREDFGRLVVDLARERVVRPPWVLVAGRLCVNASLNWGSVSGQARWDKPDPGTELRTDDDMPEELRDYDAPPPWGASDERARVLAHGEAVLDVLPALREAPYGEEDVAVVFDQLDFGNRGVIEHFWAEDERTTLACFALARAQVRPLSSSDSAETSGPVHPVRTCVVHTFKLSTGEGASPVIAPVVRRHVGPDLVIGETWG
ncbi:hypothetical protein [Streptomyces sp. NPDC047097]|uniref:hypothetical protein n=1 Tax=Streptomyces sp. NPDC047097 TaxID=3155260 RepID=UPI0033E41BD7